MGKKYNRPAPVGRNSKPVPGNPTRNGRFTFDEFKDAIASDATKENEALKEEIARLKRKHSKEIEELNYQLEERKEWVRALSNRCQVFTQGLFCGNCTIRECKYNVYFQYSDEINNFIASNRINFDDPAGLEKYGRFIQELSKKAAAKEEKDGK